MPGIGQHGDFGLGLRAPEHEDNRTILFVHGPQNGIGELLPPLSFMGIGGMRTHGQNRVQHEHTLLRPVHQITVVRHAAADIVMKLLVNVDKGGRQRLLRWQHGKTQAVCLPRLVVRILSQDHHLHLCERCQMQCVENILRRRIDNLCLILPLYKGIKLTIIGLPEFTLQSRQPVIGNPCHISHLSEKRICRKHPARIVVIRKEKLMH